jgi:3-oxoadipate enol-lactonase
MVTGVKLAYDDAGSGDCVVLIHGHPFDRALWQPQLAALRDGFRVVAPDLRGFGHSPVTQRLVTMREFAADIEELLGVLGIGRAAVVGAHRPWASVSFQRTYPRARRASSS